MKRFGEWQMRTYRPPGWYKEILQGYPCMEKRGEGEEENRWVPDKWVSSRGKYAWEIILKMNFLGRPDNIGEDIVRFVAGMGTWELSFPTSEGGKEGGGGRG